MIELFRWNFLAAQVVKKLVEGRLGDPERFEFLDSLF